MDPATVLKTSGEALTLVSALAKLIKENKSKPKPSLSELLGRLQIDAVRISSEIEGRLELLSAKLQDLGLDPTKSLESQVSDLTWYNWIRRTQLNNYREQFQSAYRQLTCFIDDATQEAAWRALGRVRRRIRLDTPFAKRC